MTRDLADMESEPYPLPLFPAYESSILPSQSHGNLQSGLDNQTTLRKQKKWARLKRVQHSSKERSPVQSKRPLSEGEDSISEGKRKKLKAQIPLSTKETDDSHVDQCYTIPTAEAARQPCRSP
ncbi:hypothetical protein U1Q18_002254 [Sarracenia purpurea var. burkii]